MTCIVGIEENGKVYMGGDSAGVKGMHVTNIKAPKVFRNGEFLIGFTSSFRMGQLLQYKFNPPYHKPETDDMTYMVTEFVEGIRNCFKEGGYARADNGEESGGSFLIGYRGHLYEMGSDYQIAVPGEGWQAIGCGDEFALGSLFATAGAEPSQRIREALQAAENYSTGVERPFTILGGDNDER